MILDIFSDCGNYLMYMCIHVFFFEEQGRKTVSTFDGHIFRGPELEFVSVSDPDTISFSPCLRSFVCLLCLPATLNAPPLHNLQFHHSFSPASSSPPFIDRSLLLSHTPVNLFFSPYRSTLPNVQNEQKPHEQTS